MKKFRKVWTPEIHKWLIENKNEDRNILYQKFIEKFDIHDVTFTAFNNERSRIGATAYKNPHKSTFLRPIGTEALKKGYVRVKVAQPNVWVFKNVYVWNQNHPEDPVIPKKEMVIFLNGNIRDFRIENLQKIPREIASIFNQLGGVVKDHPEETLLHIKQAQVKHQLFNRARQFGLLRKNGRFLEDTRAYQRRKWAAMTDEEKQAERKRISDKQNERRKKLKLENPELYQEKLKKERERRKRLKERRRQQNDQSQN